MARNESISSKPVVGSEPAAVLRSSVTPYAYRDVPGYDLERLDVLEQFQANLSHLEDLQSRLQFMLKEIHSLIRKG